MVIATVRRPTKLLMGSWAVPGVVSGLIAMTLELPRTIVSPSGGAFATDSIAIAPSAPGLLSTTTMLMERFGKVGPARASGIGNSAPAAHRAVAAAILASRPGLSLPGRAVATASTVVCGARSCLAGVTQGA